MMSSDSVHKWLALFPIKIDARLKFLKMEFVFAEDYEEDKFLLFELPSEEFLQDLVSGRTKLEYVSNEKDPIVLCTQNKTFEIMEFDTSNILLVHDGPNVLSGNTSTFELRDKQPPFLSFRKMLHERPITEAEIKGEPIENPIYMDELHEKTLCSVAEFEQMLIDLSVISINGIAKTPTTEMRNFIINQVLQFSRTLDEWKCINIQQCLEAVNIPLIQYQPMKDIFYAVLRSFSFEMNEIEAILDERKITRHLAEYIFRKARNGFITKDEFEEEMDDLLPTGEKFDKEHIYGMFVTKGKGYQFVDEEMLPIDLLERFNFLFKINSQWEPHEIEPFFKYFISESLPFNDLAGRHCRFSDGLWMHR